MSPYTELRPSGCPADSPRSRWRAAGPAAPPCAGSIPRAGRPRAVPPPARPAPARSAARCAGRSSVHRLPREWGRVASGSAPARSHRRRPRDHRRRWPRSAAASGRRRRGRGPPGIPRTATATHAPPSTWLPPGARGRNGRRCGAGPAHRANAPTRGPWPERLRAAGPAPPGW
jgi:hypothetical protein